MTEKNKEQIRRFIDKAREIEAEEDPSVFDRIFSKIVPPKKPKRKPKSEKNNGC